MRLALRFAAELLGAPERCAALLEPGRDEASIEACWPTSAAPASWPSRELASFARGEKPELPPDIAVGRLRRRRRPWGAIVLRWPGRSPSWNTRHALTRLVAATNEQVERLEARRLAEVRSRIDRKIVEQVRPKDLLYQVLDGLRSLTGYDHSGSVLLRAEAAPALEMVAEQLAFRKGRSARIGAAVAISDARRAALGAAGSRGFSRRGGAWRAWDERTDADSNLAEWLESALPPILAEAPVPAEIIVAPLLAHGDLVGVVRIAAMHAGTFWPYECELVDALLPHALLSLRNARRAESLEDQVIQSERKHAMAELARGVSHDVNNALGTVLPLIQQLRAEAAERRVDAATLPEDLATIERSLQSCVRIFNNMLQFARRTADETIEPSARVDLALEAVHAIHGDGFRRHGISFERRVDDDLPLLPLRQAELEQVVLNLVANARDALVACGGGEIVVRASLESVSGRGTPERRVKIEVHDDGEGIPAAQLSRVLEPFYTTKPRGNGLGLSICR
ncbi:MAG: HAMP domain-containing histidine kinase, partial [Phycisphaerae bacterium]|nr:HAMP domain-containing histidine kinase [Phycisphaerae bacterium]